MRTVHAAGLSLEPQIAAHAGEMYAVLCDPAIYEFENEPPISEAWLRSRYARLESRISADGSEQWLNWVVRLPSQELAGFVQATVTSNGNAHIAYLLASRYWGRGIGQSAVTAMLNELWKHHGAPDFFATLKSRNLRSLALLRRLEFTMAPAERVASFSIESDEIVLCRTGGPLPPVN